MLLLLAAMDTPEEKLDFVQIYRKNYKKMYYVAYRMLGSKEEAEDAVQDAFVKLADRFSRYRRLPEDKMCALCITILRNQSIDRIRQNRHLADTDVEELLLYWADERPDAQQLVEQGELSASVKSALAQLPEVMKLTLELKYYQEYSNQEIARILNVPVKTVEMRLYRGKKRLEVLLHEEI
ncbi:MAG: RNA polymerase sigma factor [Lachnospiraceae bacterium]|nr:RNA polymerase sigma factor [Lachnospiraceae bacterium]